MKNGFESPVGVSLKNRLQNEPVIKLELVTMCNQGLDISIENLMKMVVTDEIFESVKLLISAHKDARVVNDTQKMVEIRKSLRDFLDRLF